MSYERGSEVATYGGSSVRSRIGKAGMQGATRNAGTSGLAQRRRSANGLQGYDNLAGYDGLGFSLTSLIPVAASFIPGGSTAVGVFSAIKPVDAKDAERIATAQANMNAVLNGGLAAPSVPLATPGVTALAWIQSQATSSATAAGKQAYQTALATIQQKYSATTGQIIPNAPPPGAVPVSAPTMYALTSSGGGLFSNPVVILAAAGAAFILLRKR